MIPLNSEPLQAEVSIKGADETYHHVESCDSVDGTSACNVDMKMLGGEPFNLEEHEGIHASVKLGEEIYSDPSVDNVKFITGADTVLKPVISDAKDTSLTLNWSTPGSAPISDYQIEWTAFDGAPFTFLYKTQLTSYQVTELKPDTSYSFKIRALNVCGAGDFSQTVSASTL
jgi:hypothetical protein